jgi:hypothetical protein
VSKFERAELREALAADGPETMHILLCGRAEILLNCADEIEEQLQKELCAQLNYAADAQEANRWRKMEEEKPVNAQVVLAYHGTEIHVAYYTLATNVWYSLTGYDLPGVTHWRPLPSPPEVEE